MSSDSVNHYRLTPQSLADLDGIWRYSAENWSIVQADAHIDSLAEIFDLLVSMPSLGRERHEFRPPVRVHIHQTHLIIYVVEPGFINILRLLDGRQNWQAILSKIEP